MIFGIGQDICNSKRIEATLNRFGDRFKNINLAISYLEKNNIKIVKKSSYYETLSFPDKKKPKFINTIINLLIIHFIHQKMILLHFFI